MSKEIDLTAVFRAIVREYERIAPQLVKTGIEQEVPDGPLVWAHHGAHSDAEIDQIKTNVGALLDAEKISALEGHWLRSAGAMAMNTISRAEDIKDPDHVLQRLHEWADSSYKNRSYALPPYLAIVGLRAHCQNEGLSIQAPDTAELKAFLQL